MKKENLIICDKCCRGDFKSIEFYYKNNEWLKNEQTFPKYYSGCSKCCGFGYIAVRNDCKMCGKEIWHRPGAFTIYDGKIINSYNNVKIIYKDYCWYCEKCLDFNKK
jgi:hypothetical protein